MWGWIMLGAGYLWLRCPGKKAQERAFEDYRQDLDRNFNQTLRAFQDLQRQGLEAEFQKGMDEEQAREREWERREAAKAHPHVLKPKGTP